MPAEKFFADSPAEVGLDPDEVRALMDRAERDASAVEISSTRRAGSRRIAGSES
jgi:hypothetical protein